MRDVSAFFAMVALIFVFRFACVNLNLYRRIGEVIFVVFSGFPPPIDLRFVLPFLALYLNLYHRFS